jgi:solute:Na+ symporter, SSS family
MGAMNNLCFFKRFPIQLIFYGKNEITKKFMILVNSAFKSISTFLIFILYSGLFFFYSANLSAKQLKIPTVEDHSDWKKLEIPNPPIVTNGQFKAIYQEYLVFAGGYDKENETFTDHIQILNLAENEWFVTDIRLNEKMGYGATVVTDEGIYMLGGINNDGVKNTVLKLFFDYSEGKWIKEKMPDIPKPRALLGSCKLNDKIYLAGGIDNDLEYSTDFYLFDYKLSDWQILNSIPVKDPFSPSLQVQSNGEIDLIYLLAGNEDEEEMSYVSFNPIKKEWKKLQSPPLNLNNPHCFKKGGFHLMFLPDSDFFPFGKENPETFISQKGLLYHTITNTWIIIDSLEVQSLIGVLPHGSEYIFINKSNEVFEYFSVSEKYQSTGLKIPDILTFTSYILVLLYLGYWFSKRSTNTDGYFRGGKRVPAWAAGLSIMATKLSAVTFMSIPAKVFATDWLYVLIPLSGLVLAYFVVNVILPFFHRLDITSAYEYLEKRFNLSVRILGSFTYLIWEISRVGILLLLPSIVISIVAGINIYLCITLIGFVAVAYTLMGGIEAVIWTDVLQVVVMFGGILLTLILIVINTDGSLTELIHSASSQNKFKAFDFNFDFTTATVWVIAIGWIGRIQEYVSTQSIVQRFITVKDVKAAGKSMWISAISVIPIIIFFYLTGTALFLFYQEFPQKLNTNISQLDAILPFFIITELPLGIAGLVIAGIFAAAMSSLDSGIHSMSTVIIVDYYNRLSPNHIDKESYRYAKILVIILGLFGIISAMLMASIPIQSLFDQLMTIMGLFGGGLAGIFLLGMLTHRANSLGVIIGFIISGIFQYFVSFHTNIHFLLFSVTGLFSCFIISYLASIIASKTKYKKY